MIAASEGAARARGGATIDYVPHGVSATMILMQSQGTLAYKLGSPPVMLDSLSALVDYESICLSRATR
jgi:hypothetical protein